MPKSCEWGNEYRVSSIGTLSQGVKKQGISKQVDTQSLILITQRPMPNVHYPLPSIASALSCAFAFCRDSYHSLSGLLSATIPAPT